MFSGCVNRYQLQKWHTSVVFLACFPASTRPKESVKAGLKQFLIITDVYVIKWPIGHSKMNLQVKFPYLYDRIPLKLMTTLKLTCYPNANIACWNSLKYYIYANWLQIHFQKNWSALCSKRKKNYSLSLITQ